MTQLILFFVLLIGFSGVAAQNLYGFTFVGAAPGTYDHQTGGGVYNNGGKADVVTSLEGPEFHCLDVITFLTQITANNKAPNDQVMDLYYSFSAFTTGQQGTAFNYLAGVRINRGVGDTGNVEDGGSTVTVLSNTLTGPSFEKSNNMLLVLRVNDIDKNEKIVARVDVVIDCIPDSVPTGNMRGSLDKVVLVTGGANTVVSAGAGTVTLKASGIDPSTFELTKTITSDCVGDGESVNVEVGFLNTVAIPFEIRTLEDTVNGATFSLDGQGTCILPIILNPNEPFSCQFSQTVHADALTDVVTAVSDRGYSTQAEATACIITTTVEKTTAEFTTREFTTGEYTTQEPCDCCQFCS